MAVWKRGGGSGNVLSNQNRDAKEGGDAVATKPAPAAVKPEAPKPPPAKFLAKSSTLRTQLGADAKVTGKLSFNAPTRIDGKLNGELSCTDLLVIGESGSVDGNVRATELVVLGTVLGDVRGAQRIEIGPQGRIHGTIETHALAVREGGRLDGACRVLPAKADVHVLAKRRAETEVDD